MTSPASSTPRLTLVVATYGRRRELHDLLQSIDRRHLHELEVLVIDQNTEDLHSDLASSFNHLRLRRLPVRFRNANAARNLGAAHAAGSWLMFPDDDATFQPETLAHALALIASDDFDLISGQIVNEANIPHLLQWLAHPAEITPRTFEHTLVESSFFIRRSIFLDTNGFDPLFGPGGEFPSAEGADLIYRLWRSRTLRSRFDPAISLYHPSKQAAHGMAARQRIHDFAVGEGAFTTRHYRALPLLTIARKLLFRTAGLTICRGEKRLRNIAYLRGFFKGASSYLKSHRSVSDRAQLLERSSAL